MTPSRTSSVLVAVALVIIIILGGILFATGYFGERTEAPVPTVIHAGWKYWSGAPDNIMMTFEFPEDIGTKYITTTDWPPKLQLIDGPFSCTPAGAVNMPAGKTQMETINGREYCVTTEVEGAAGSTYLMYAYAFPITDDSSLPAMADDFSNGAEKVAIMTFGLRKVQCVNYDDHQRSECENEQATFDISSLVDEMAQTIQPVKL